MASGFKDPISIKEAIDNIFERKYLLPAIQRKFVWSSTQIEMLFDSILRGYPINSFMFWEVRDGDVKSNFKFYEFIEEYREFFKVNNPNKDTTGVPDFKAVIDGQQRLTSLYIGLRGSYAYKIPKKWTFDTEENIPTRRLFLNLKQQVKQEHDNQKKYDFRFLTKHDLVKYSNDTQNYLWFEARKILELEDLKKVNKYLKDNNLSDNDFASDTLIDFHQRIHADRLINFYLEEQQEPDKVLEVFIRTNSGGTALSFSNLLMSIASANWEKVDARKEIDTLVDKIYLIGRPGFMINADFVLKTCLVLFTNDIKFKLGNFDHKNVQIFENNWEGIKESIIAGFTLVEKLGFNDKTLRAKNAVIPIIYYIYHKKISATINNPNYHKEDKKLIARWLNLSLLKSIFGGQTDNILNTLRRELKANLVEPNFPLEKIRAAFKANPNRNYSLDDDFIDGLLTCQYESNESFYVLSLLYPHLDYYNQDFHKDHLHPSSFFKNKNNIATIFNDDEKAFCGNPDNWNSILNLQLLNGNLNKSKQDKSLLKWATDNKILHDDLYVEKNVNLDISNFKAFILDRKEKLRDKLKSIIA